MVDIDEQNTYKLKIYHPDKTFSTIESTIQNGELSFLLGEGLTSHLGIQKAVVEITRINQDVEAVLTSEPFSIQINQPDIGTFYSNSQGLIEMPNKDPITGAIFKTPEEFGYDEYSNNYNVHIVGSGENQHLVDNNNIAVDKCRDVGQVINLMFKKGIRLVQLLEKNYTLISPIFMEPGYNGEIRGVTQIKTYTALANNNDVDTPGRTILNCFRPADCDKLNNKQAIILDGTSNFKLTNLVIRQSGKIFDIGNHTYGFDSHEICSDNSPRCGIYNGRHINHKSTDYNYIKDCHISLPNQQKVIYNEEEHYLQTIGFYNYASECYYIDGFSVKQTIGIVNTQTDCYNLFIAMNREDRDRESKRVLNNSGGPRTFTVNYYNNLLFNTDFAITFSGDLTKIILKNVFWIAKNRTSCTSSSNPQSDRSSDNNYLVLSRNPRFIATYPYSYSSYDTEVTLNNNAKGNLTTNLFHCEFDVYCEQLDPRATAWDESTTEGEYLYHYPYLINTDYALNLTDCNFNFRYVEDKIDPYHGFIKYNYKADQEDSHKANFDTLVWENCKFYMSYNNQESYPLFQNLDKYLEMKAVDNKDYKIYNYDQAPIQIQNCRIKNCEFRSEYKFSLPENDFISGNFSTNAETIGTYGPPFNDIQLLPCEDQNQPQINLTFQSNGMIIGKSQYKPSQELASIPIKDGSIVINTFSAPTLFPTSEDLEKDNIQLWIYKNNSWKEIIFEQQFNFIYHSDNFINGKVIKINGRIPERYYPIRFGYKLNGWHFDSPQGQEYNYSDPIIENTTVYQDWSESNNQLDYQTDMVNGSLLDSQGNNTLMHIPGTDTYGYAKNHYLDIDATPMDKGLKFVSNTVSVNPNVGLVTGMIKIDNDFSKKIEIINQNTLIRRVNITDQIVQTFNSEKKYINSTACMRFRWDKFSSAFPNFGGGRDDDKIANQCYYYDDEINDFKEISRDSSTDYATLLCWRVPTGTGSNSLPFYYVKQDISNHTVELYPIYINSTSSSFELLANCGNIKNTLNLSVGPTTRPNNSTYIAFSLTQSYTEQPKVIFTEQNFNT